jgi:hypothetical protein
MTADVEALKDALVNACTTLVQAGEGAAQSAMATAGLVTKEQFAALAPGLTYPNRDLTDASSLASQAYQTMQAAYSCADALSKLNAAFPTPAPPPTTP